MIKQTQNWSWFSDQVAVLSLIVKWNLPFKVEIEYVHVDCLIHFE